MVLIFLCSQIQTSSTPQTNSLEIEKIVAVVNNQPILKTDIIWNLALDPKVSNGELFLAETQQQMLERLIDQKLLLQEAKGLPAVEPTEAEVAQAIAKLIELFPSEAFFYDRIASVGLTKNALQDIIRSRLIILNFIDFRFRAFATVSETEIVNYYEKFLLPRLPSKEARPMQTAERDLIEKILIEEQVSNATESYIDELRQQAEIIIIE